MATGKQFQEHYLKAAAGNTFDLVAASALNQRAVTKRDDHLAQIRTNAQKQGQFSSLFCFMVPPSLWIVFFCLQRFQLLMQSILLPLDQQCRPQLWIMLVMWLKSTFCLSKAGALCTSITFCRAQTEGFSRPMRRTSPKTLALEWQLTISRRQSLNGKKENPCKHCLFKRALWGSSEG